MKCEQCGETFPSEHYFPARSGTGGRTICRRCFDSADAEQKLRWVGPGLPESEPRQAPQAVPGASSPVSAGRAVAFFILWLALGFVASTFFSAFSLFVAVGGDGGGGAISVALAIGLGGLIATGAVIRGHWVKGDRASAAGCLVGVAFPLLLAGVCFLALVSK